MVGRQRRRPYYDSGRIGLRADHDLNAFKDSSPNIAIWAWYHPPNQWDYQAWLQKTCMEILERFDSEGIRFALPTQMLRLPKDEKRLLELRMIKGEQTDSDR